VNGPDVATTATQRIDHLRHVDVKRAVAHLAGGDPWSAFDRLAMTVELQALLGGCGMVTIPRPLGVPNLSEVPD